MNCQSNSLRRKALREDLDLAGLMKAGRALELSERQEKEFESLEKIVNVVKPLKKGTPAQAKGKQRRQQNHRESRNCYRSRRDDGKDEKCRNCGGTYPHKDSCPAKNRKCSSYGKLNHFARVCRTNPTKLAKHLTHQDPGEEDEHVYTVGRDKQPMCKVMIDGKQVEMLVDSGASVDLIDEKSFRELYKDKKQGPEKTKRRISSSDHQCRYL